MVALALGVSLTACETEKPNCPARGEQSQAQEEPGVEVLIEFVDSETGETTRTKTGDPNYSFTPFGEDGDVQMEGARRYYPDRKNLVYPEIKFYAEQNIIFKGWSWRYVDDPKGTHRDKDGNKVSDYVRDVALQTEPGVQPLNNGVTGFTCKYRPDSDHNRALVKVEYYKSQTPLYSYPPERTGMEDFSHGTWRELDALIKQATSRNFYAFEPIRKRLEFFRQKLAVYVSEYADHKDAYYKDLLDDGIYNMSVTAYEGDPTPPFQRLRHVINEVKNAGAEPIELYDRLDSSRNISFKSLYEALEFASRRMDLSITQDYGLYGPPEWLRNELWETQRLLKKILGARGAHLMGAGYSPFDMMLLELEKAPSPTK